MIYQNSLQKIIRVIQITIVTIPNTNVTNINFSFREGNDGIKRQKDILAMVKDVSSRERISSWVIHYEVSLNKVLPKIVISPIYHYLT